MKRIGYHGEVGALVIVGSNVFPPGTLSLIEAEGDFLEIWSLAQRAELRVPWQEVMTLDGLTFDARVDAVAYLRGEFNRRPNQIESGSASPFAIGGHRVISATDLGVRYASSDDPISVETVLGLTDAASDAGTPLSYRREGAVDEPSWSWALGPVFLGLNGLLTQIAPDQGAVLQIGIAPSPTRLLLDIQEPYHLAS